MSRLLRWCGEILKHLQSRGGAASKGSEAAGEAAGARARSKSSTKKRKEQQQQLEAGADKVGLGWTYDPALKLQKHCFKNK